MLNSLGINFSGDSIFFTELSSEAGIIKLENAEELKTDFSFEEELYKHKSNTRELTNISGEIQNYLNRRNLQNVHISAAMGTSQAFLITLPVDFSGGKQALNSKIYWELSNYFPDNYNDFIINTYRMNSILPCKDSDEFLIIAVPKNSLEFIKRVFGICHAELKLVDIDHFAAENAFRINYSEQAGDKNILLIGLKKGRVDYGFISDKKYKFYGTSKYSSDPEFNLSIIRKINSLLASPKFQKGVDVIYLYGNEISLDTVESLRKSGLAEVEIMNPFESINASDKFLKDEDLRKNSYRFAASCGAALRNLAVN